MAHSNTVLSQMLKMLPRHEFEKLANTVDGRFEPLHYRAGASLWH